MVPTSHPTCNEPSRRYGPLPAGRACRAPSTWGEVILSGIFVSYRRDDSQGFAGRLADDLTDIFGPDKVFRDVEIPIGHDFVDILHRAVAASDVLLVVIGRQWEGASSSGERSRLFEPTDWVRAEIEAALTQGKEVIPVLVGEAHMPRAADLPESLAPLSRLQAFAMHDRQWNTDLQQLVALLQQRFLALRSGALARRSNGEESPAAVLRELGERVLEEVFKARAPQPATAPASGGWTATLGRSLWRGLRRTAVSAATVAAIYVGLRLFGDAEVQNILDVFEQRLQLAGDRVMAYLRDRSI